MAQAALRELGTTELAAMQHPHVERAADVAVDEPLSIALGVLDMTSVSSQQQLEAGESHRTIDPRVLDTAAAARAPRAKRPPTAQNSSATSRRAPAKASSSSRTRVQPPHAPMSTNATAAVAETGLAAGQGESAVSVADDAVYENTVDLFTGIVDRYPHDVPDDVAHMLVDCDEEYDDELDDGDGSGCCESDSGMSSSEDELDLHGSLINRHANGDGDVDGAVSTSASTATVTSMDVSQEPPPRRGPIEQWLRRQPRYQVVLARATDNCRYNNRIRLRCSTDNGNGVTHTTTTTTTSDDSMLNEYEDEECRRQLQQLHGSLEEQLLRQRSVLLDPDELPPPVVPPQGVRIQSLGSFRTLVDRNVEEMPDKALTPEEKEYKRQWKRQQREQQRQQKIQEQQRVRSGSSAARGRPAKKTTAAGRASSTTSNARAPSNKSARGRGGRASASATTMTRTHSLPQSQLIMSEASSLAPLAPRLYGSTFADPNQRWTDGTWINADARYCNFSALGKFDVIYMDPPWRIRGNEVASHEKTMFNNSRFFLTYNTLTNEEIMDLDIGVLTDGGLLFLWVINSQMQLGLECMSKWGFLYTDRIVWVKKTGYDRILVGPGHYVLHSSEICLIGVKNTKGRRAQYIPKVSNDVIFAAIRKRSQKPEQMYEIIERMVPGGRKLEIFGRNHCIRPSWLTIGNQLGEYYDWDHDLIQCDLCESVIPTGKVRLKSRTIPNKDLCRGCFERSGELEEDYFLIENIFEEMAFHEYIACDICSINPIPGIRFSCTVCPNFDVCETCYDAGIDPEKKHNKEHLFNAIEVPELAGGLPIHRVRCWGCFTSPIVGSCFVCLDCRGLFFCQKCFFLEKEPKSHVKTHNMQVLLEPLEREHQVKCVACGISPIMGIRYKCNSCFHFDLCQNCHDTKAPIPANFISHRPGHTFTRITN